MFAVAMSCWLALELVATILDTVKYRDSLFMFLSSCVVFLLFVWSVVESLAYFGYMVKI